MCTMYYFSGVLIASNIWVSSRTENTLNKWKILQVHTTLKNGIVVEKCDVIFLAVKPHLLDSMIQDTVNSLTQTATSKLFISVLAGVPLDTLMNVSMCLYLDSYNKLIPRIANFGFTKNIVV